MRILLLIGFILAATVHGQQQNLRAFKSDYTQYVGIAYPSAGTGSAVHSLPDALPGATLCLQETAAGDIVHAAGACGTAGGTSMGASGAIQFSDGGGSFLADDPNFHFDDTNNRLGIGTNTPSHDIQVLSSASAATQVRVTNTSAGSGAFAGFIGVSDGSVFQSAGVGGSGLAGTTFGQANAGAVSYLGIGGKTLIGTTSDHQIVLGVNDIARGRFLSGSPGGFQVEDGAAYLKLVPDSAGIRQISSDVGNLMYLTSAGNARIGVAGSTIIDVGSASFRWNDSASLLTVTGDVEATGSIEVGTDFWPDADGGANIGSSAVRFATGYTDTFNTEFLQIENAAHTAHYQFQFGTSSFQILDTAAALMVDLTPSGSMKFNGNLEPLGSARRLGASTNRWFESHIDNATIYTVISPEINNGADVGISGNRFLRGYFSDVITTDVTLDAVGTVQFAGSAGRIDFLGGGTVDYGTGSGVLTADDDISITAGTVSNDDIFITAGGSITFDAGTIGIVIADRPFRVDRVFASNNLAIDAGTGVSDNLTLSAGADIILNAGGTGDDIIANDLVIANAGIDAPASGINALSFSLEGPGTILSVSAGNSRSNFDEYFVNGVAGIDLTCTGGQVVINANYDKGILTAGTCAAN